MPHTILLIQATKDISSRTFADYNNLNDALEGVCKIFEENLKKMHHSSPQITYWIWGFGKFVEKKNFHFF